MLDIYLIIDNHKEIISKLKTRGHDLLFDEIENLYKERKLIIRTKEDLASKKNQISDNFNKSTNNEKINLRLASESLEKKIQENKSDLENIENSLKDLMLEVPNIPSDDVPIGNDSSMNVILKQSSKTNMGSTVDHSALFDKNNLLDFESSVKLSKSRFCVMKKDLAKLSRSLISYCLDYHVDNNNYIEHYVPYIVNRDTLIGTGQLPKFKEDLFKIHNEDLYLIPTAEVPLTNLYRDLIINGSDLPLKLVSHTPCFRSEAGTYGKDTKGIIRQHQFEKVEIVQIVDPEKSNDALEEITRHAEILLENLEIPYQRVSLCTGDLGFSAAKTYDIEAWFPGQNTFREVSSCSLFGDFQSRRSNIKFKSIDKKKYFPHTLNGSALAIGRTLAALIENKTQGNEIHIPKVLHKYTGFTSIKL